MNADDSAPRIHVARIMAESTAMLLDPDTTPVTRAAFVRSFTEALDSGHFSSTNTADHSFVGAWMVALANQELLSLLAEHEVFALVRGLMKFYGKTDLVASYKVRAVINPYTSTSFDVELLMDKPSIRLIKS